MAQDPIDEAREGRGKKYRRKERKEAALKDARQFRERQEKRLKELRAERDEARKAGNQDRVDALNFKIDEQVLALERTRESLERLGRVVPNVRESWRKAKSRVQRLVRKRKARRKKKRQAAKDDVTATPGSTHWGGSQDILENEVDPVADRMGHYETSNKRTETYGNPGSDHHVSQVWASAKDYAPGVSFAIAAAKSLGVAYGGYGDDYRLYYITREGRQYRVQIIAQNHGTGPHVHIGLELT